MICKKRRIKELIKKKLKLRKKLKIRIRIIKRKSR
jgi:hypothetical protein